MPFNPVKLPQVKQVSHKEARENLHDTSKVKQGMSIKDLDRQALLERMYAEMLDFVALWITSKHDNGIQITPEEFIFYLKVALREEASYYKQNADRCAAVLELIKDIDK